MIEAQQSPNWRMMNTQVASAYRRWAIAYFYKYSK